MNQKWLLCGGMLRKVQTTTGEHNKHKSKKTCLTCSFAVCEFRMHDGDLFINDNAMILYGNNRTRTRHKAANTCGTVQSYERLCRGLTIKQFDCYPPKRKVMIVFLWVCFYLENYLDIYFKICQRAKLLQAACARAPLGITTEVVVRTENCKT